MNLDTELDKWFSLFIRLRAADSNGMVHCYTCPVRKHYKQMQCGHFIRRRHGETRIDEKNARPQCEECNELKDGQEAIFEEELREELGDDVVNKLIAAQFKPMELRPELYYLGRLDFFKTSVKNHPAYQK